MTDNQEFSLAPLASQYSPLRVTTTLDKLFSSSFISFFVNTPFLIKSIEPFSELSGISMTLDCDGEMLLTLSKSLDQASGLDASKQLVDSVNFDSSTRLLQFNLHDLAKQKNRLERIQKNSQAALSRPQYSCDFVAMVETVTIPQYIESLGKMNINASFDDSLRPKLIEKNLSPIPWPVKDEFSLKDNPELLDLFDWIGIALSPDSYKPVTDETEYFKAENCKYLTLEGPLLPSLLETISALSATSTRLILSLKCCKAIPPPFELNLHRLKHFNERKFDATTCTADQMAMTLFKSPSGILSFRLNSTA